MRFLTDKSKFAASLKPFYESSTDSHFEKVKGLNPLHFAARHNLDKVASVMLRDGDIDIDVNAKNGHRRPPVDLAACGWDKRILPILLSYPQVINNSGGVPYDVNLPQMKYLHMHLRSPLVPRDLTPLHLAALLDLDEAMADLLKEPHADLEAQDHLGRTLLAYAAVGYAGGFKGNVLYQLLLMPGIEIDSTIACGTSSLRLDVGKSLNEMGIETASIPTKLTPLHVAAVLGFDKVCKALLKNPRVELNAHDSSGRTPLWYAAGDKLLQCLELLLAAPGIDPTLTSYSGDLPKCQAPNFRFGLDMIAEKRRFI